MGTRTDRLMNGADAAKLLNISETSFWRLVHAGKIPVVDLSGSGKAGRGRKLWQFREGALWDYVEGCTRPMGGGGKATEPPAPRPKVPGESAMLAAGWNPEITFAAPKRARRGG